MNKLTDRQTDGRNL